MLIWHVCHRSRSQHMHLAVYAGDVVQLACCNTLTPAWLSLHPDDSVLWPDQDAMRCACFFSATSHPAEYHVANCCLRGHRQVQGQSSVIILHFACVCNVAGVLTVSLSSGTNQMCLIPVMCASIYRHGTQGCTRGVCILHLFITHRLGFDPVAVPLQADCCSDQPHHAGRLRNHSSGSDLLHLPAQQAPTSSREAHQGGGCLQGPAQL